jgi:hypothetical protein
MLTNPCHCADDGGTGTYQARPNGTFEVFVYAGKDPLTGKERQRTGTARTRKEADQLRTRLLLDRFYAEVRKCGGRRAKPLAAMTVHQIHFIIRAALGLAAKVGVARPAPKHSSQTGQAVVSASYARRRPPHPCARA